jgi:hypothetical protein
MRPGATRDYNPEASKSLNSLIIIRVVMQQRITWAEWVESAVSNRRLGTSYKITLGMNKGFHSHSCFYNQNK